MANLTIMDTNSKEKEMKDLGCFIFHFNEINSFISLKYLQCGIWISYFPDFNYNYPGLVIDSPVVYCYCIFLHDSSFKHIIN